MYLSDWKYKHPGIFWGKAYIYLAQFDKLVIKLKDIRIFSNNSITGQEQISLDKQLLIDLRQVETDKKIHYLAILAGIRYGTFNKFTQMIFKASCRL